MMFEPFIDRSDPVWSRTDFIEESPQVWVIEPRGRCCSPVYRSEDIMSSPYIIPTSPHVSPNRPRCHAAHFIGVTVRFLSVGSCL